MLGDVLRSRLDELRCSSIKPNDKNSFWIVLRNIARDEIIALYPNKVDSDTIIPVYYDILSENIEYVPLELRRVLPSNNQESYRVKIRNLFSSNAFHLDGLANQEGIIANKMINESKKGYRIVYQGDKKYVDKK